MEPELARLNRQQTSSETDSFTAHRYAQFSRYLSPGATVLDVGCNTGRGGSALRALLPGVRLYGVELVAERANQIPAGLYEQIVIGGLGDVLGLNCEFDAVLLGEVIEHVPYAQLDEFIAAIHRVLRSNGQMLLTTPNPHYVLLGWRGGSVLGGAHLSVHCPHTLKELLEHRGFSVSVTKGTGRVSRLIGRHLPLPLYGSFLLVARRI